MRNGLLSSIALALGTLCVGQAHASSDDYCYPTWTLYSKQLTACSNLPFLSPSNDSRVNLRLLLADQGSLPLAPRPLSDDDLNLGFGEVPFPLYRLSPADPDSNPETTGTAKAQRAAVSEQLNSALQALGVTRDTQEVAGNAFLSGEGSRCRSNSEGSALAFVEQLNAAPLNADERRGLAQARAQMLSACSWDSGPLESLMPGNLNTPAAKDFATYLRAAADFYSGRFAPAAQGFSALKASAQPWLVETGAYMSPRNALNQAQENAFDEWGTVNLQHVDKSSLAQAGAGFSEYLKTYPQGQYADSATGLMRRVHWLAGDTRALAADYAQQLSPAPDARRQTVPDELVQEIDYKLLTGTAGEIQAPLLLTVTDLMGMRSSPPPTLTREALQQQKALFAAQPALFDYLQAAFALYVEQKPAAALQLLPTQVPAQLDYLSFSQQSLRALAMQAQQDWKGAEALWLQLLPLVKQPLQREQLDLALAYGYERSGQLAKVFASDSPIQSAQVRTLLLRQVASPKLLRQQAQQPEASTERNTALFVLLYKDLTRGQYAAFGEDFKQQPSPLPTEKLGRSLGYTFYEGPSLAVFQSNGQPEDSEEVHYACPNIKDTAATLQQDPKSPAGLLCLGEFMRLNSFDSMPLDTAPEPQALGGTPDAFPGKPFSRLDGYQVVINNPKANRDERAYALYRALNCYASSGINRCGGAGVEPAVRKAWFRQLKTKLGDTQWGQSLRYYW